MKTVSVELPVEEAQDILNRYIESRGSLVEERYDIDEKIRNLDAKIAKLRQSISETAGEPLAPERGESGRAKRGESEKLIVDFLKKQNVTGATISEIAKGTGTKYATAHRIVMALQNDSKVSHRVDRWHWGPLSEPPKIDEF